MKLSEELQWRGLVNQTTLTDLSILDKKPMTLYFGVDPSAFGMQIGNLAAAIMVRRFVDHGHRIILLVGGATGLVGDPDGRDSARKSKAKEEVSRNKAEIIAQYKQIFAGKDFEVVDNYDWFKDMNYLDFLQEVGTNVPMSQMLSREFVQSRLSAGGSGISYAEFSYSLMQAYDYLYLFRNYGVTLQLCGADQWGNCIAGIDLIRRVEAKEANIYSMPLIMNKSTGKKFGKSEDGTIWLNSSKTSVYRFYQFWLNVGDEDVIDYIKVFTSLSKEEVESLEEQLSINPSDRAAQKSLAELVTELVHGRARTDSVIRVTSVLFGSLGFDTLSDDDLNVLAEEIPVQQISKSVIEILVDSGTASSAGDAKRLIAGNAITVNDNKITSDTKINSISLIKKGKNNFILVR